MAREWTLRIGLSREQRTLPPGQAGLGQVVGGPDQLLDWLETQLGLAEPPLTYTDRVTRYARLLEKTGGASYQQSFQTDRWATAAELLRRRDELRMAGWDATADSNLPTLVEDLAAVEGADVPAGTAERIDAVGQALADGQTLPPHTLLLEDPIDAWPPRWRGLLDRLRTDQVEAPDPGAPAGTTLGAFQRSVLGTTADATGFDPSLRRVQAASVHRASQAIASMLAAQPDVAEETVLYCPDAESAGLLEEALVGEDLPAVGSRRGLSAHPLLQVLPLAIELCWEPVDPQVVVDLLSLPIGPIPRGVARKLESALSEHPGLGSQAWEKARDEIEDWDNGQALIERVDDWFDHARAPVGEPAPADLLGSRCSLVAQWARGYAEHIETEDEGDRDHLVEPLKVVAGQASALGDLVQLHGDTLGKAQIARMLEDVREAGAQRTTHPPQAGGPWLVETLADVPEACTRLIWFGTGLEDTPPSRWTKHQTDRLKQAGIEIDTGADQLSARRRAERRGLARVGEAVLVVELPGDVERRTHPLWTQALGILSDDDPPDATRLGDVVAGQADIQPWTVETAEREHVDPQPRREQWEVDPDLLSEPGTSSASEMTERLACPIKWVFHRAARIRPSPAAALPNEFMLRGTFAHQVLETVLGNWEGPLDREAIVDAIGDTFDERVALDAAPLAHPEKGPERGDLRAELLEATRTLVDALDRGDYEVVEMEAEIDAELNGRPIRGWIDSVVENDDGEAVIDFKYGGRTRYRELLRDGRAVQLAVYAAARAEQTNAPDGLDAVGYLVIKDAQLYTPEGSPLDNSDPYDVIDTAPDIRETWDRFVHALEQAQPWLDTDAPVPARPLQSSTEWPTDAGMVIETDSSKDRDELRPCKYCDYDSLCGLRGLD